MEGNITGQDMVGDVLAHAFLQNVNCAPPLLLTSKTPQPLAGLRLLASCLHLSDSQALAKPK
jgi:hypothetical protein